MKNGLLGILNKLSKTPGAVKYQFLTGSVTGFKSIPANGKRWKKNESPETAEIRYMGGYDDALQLFAGKDSSEIALIVWVPRKDFLELAEGGELAQTEDEWGACEACPKCGVQMKGSFQIILGEIGAARLAEVVVGVEYFYIDGVDINEVRLPRDEATLKLIRDLIDKLLEKDAEDHSR